MYAHRQVHGHRQDKRNISLKLNTMIKKCMMIMAACLCLAACSTLCDSDQTSIVTIDNLLDEMLDRDAMTRFPESGYVQKQVSSYDRRSIAPDQEGWFANVDGGGYERLDVRQHHGRIGYCP